MIRLRDVCLQQGSFSLTNVNLMLPQNSYAILMGASGTGKTTLLEAICGLRSIQSGSIWFGESEVSRLPPARRNIGYVPQDSVLFPTMRVDRQIEFSLEVRRQRPEARRQRAQELAELLRIQSIMQRYPTSLSGGEKQRVALARALAFRPRLLCLDEPLAALDDKTKAQISGLLKTVHEVEKVTVLHITHNREEAMELGTIRFNMEQGKVDPTDD